MGEYVRIFQSVVDPSDVDEVRRLFVDDVKPVFERMEGCRAIELIINTEGQAGGLVEGSALSRWSSLADLERAIASREVNEALVRILGLLQQEPVTKVYEVLE